MAATLTPQAGDAYFTSYCDLSVHELMLQDRPRTTFYRKFFETHRDLVKGKVVMDVGAGTGILSLFAATAGAKTVYAVEASDVASLCEEIVQDNGFESVIKVIHGAVEDISLPDGVRVDIIVSEWMGFYLLHESMLDSVLVARDRFLVPGGILVPSRACLYIAPVDMSEHFQERADYWNNVYGYDFSPVASTMNIQEVSKPLVKTLAPSAVKADAVKLLDLNLGTMSVEQVTTFSESCKFLMSDESRIHGFVTWFDVSFEEFLTHSAGGGGGGGVTTAEIKTTGLSHSNNETTFSSCDTGKISQQNVVVDFTGDAKMKTKVSDSGNNGCDSDMPYKKVSDCHTDQLCTQNSNSFSKPSGNTNNEPSVILSTSPFSPATHWKQTVIFLPQTIMVIKDVLLCCKVKMNQDASNKRHYNISIELKEEGDLGDNDEDDDENTNDVEDEEDNEDSDDSCDHPVPCDCGSNRCRLIAALVDKYDTEHQELEEEAEMVEMEAEVEAAKEIDSAIEIEGWSLDTSGTDQGELNTSKK